ncbi:unnamed protein product [Auanema sp. JU1783]|nr:unnamed protein product [Auanema sp. JU1783]
MVISQLKCETIVETNLVEKVCPQFLRRAATTDNTCDSSDHNSFKFHFLHLIRDTNAVHRPKLLYLLGGSGGFVFFSIVDIEMPERTNISKIATSIKEISPSTLPHYSKLSLSVQSTDVTNSIYDNEAQLLYLMTKTGPRGTPSSHCFVFGVRDVFTSGQSTIQPIFEFPLHISMTGKYYWSADPYSDEIYYSTSVTGEHTSTLFMIKSKKLLFALRYGDDGIVVSPPHTKRLHYIVSGNVMFSYGLGDQSIEGHDLVGYMKSANNSSEFGISCTAKISDYHERFRTLPSFQAVIVIRDVDYCLLNGLDDYYCKKEYDAFMIDNGYVVEEGMSSGTVFLLVLVVFLSILVLLLLLCVCCMKRNLENSYFEEKGQPTVYYPNLPRNPSFLDDSVDTWRH